MSTNSSHLQLCEMSSEAKPTQHLFVLTQKS